MVNLIAPSLPTIVVPLFPFARQLLRIYSANPATSSMSPISFFNQHPFSTNDLQLTHIFYFASYVCLIEPATLPKAYPSATLPNASGTLNDNKTKRGITTYRLLSRYTALWQEIRCRFSFCLGFRGRMLFLVVAKNLEQHTSTTK